MASGNSLYLGPGYVTAVYACVAVLVAMLSVAMFYVLCSRRFKLNWYEQTRLMASASQSHNLIQATDYEDEEDQKSEKTSFSGGSKAPSSGIFSLFSKTAAVDNPAENNKDKKQDLSLSGLHSITCFGPDKRDDSSLFDCVATTKYVQPGANINNEAANQGSRTRPRLTSMHSKLDHTKIDAALYENNEQGQSQGLPEDMRGSINFSIHYDSNLELLRVHVKQACDLVPRQFSGTADPYAEIRIIPDKKTSRKSCVHKNTVNPQFNEDFIFDVRPHQLTSCILLIILFDYNEYSRHECMGSVELPLEHIDLSERVTLWKELSPYDSQPEASGGELMISLCYLPSAQRLNVVILKARNIGVIQDEDKTNIDCYVKVVLNHNGKKIKKKKTTAQKGLNDFVFNEALSFDINKDILNSMDLVLSLVNDNMIGQNTMLGRILIGKNSFYENAIGHYKELLSSKGSAIAMWHQLSVPR